MELPQRFPSLIAMRSVVLALAALAVVSSPAQAQFIFGRKPPPPATPTDESIWPYPNPDPQSWWDEKRPEPPEAANPLGERRISRSQRVIPIDNGIDPSTYRLWGLPPLQWQLLRGGEFIIEVWVRPARNVRQSIVRVTVREDGKTFLQGRAGLACCDAGIGRRIGFDVEMPEGSAKTFLPLRDLPLWETPREVQVVRNETTTDVVCVSGVGYDLTLLTARGARSLHRDCDEVSIGQTADVLETVLEAALGHEPRFDVLFRNKIDFSLERQAYQEFVAAGGVLKAAPRNRSAPPGTETTPQPGG